MLHEDEATAIDRGIDGAHFFGYSLAHYYGMGQHQPGRTVVWDEFLANRDERGFARSLITPDAAPLAVKIMQHGLGSLRGAIGKPEQVLDLCRRYEAVGVDQVIFVLQAGPNRHEHICESLELFARRVMPEFTLDREHREQAKVERLAPAVTRALARREPARGAPPAYVINEQAELERAARARREGGLRRRLAELARGGAPLAAARRPGGAGAARARRQRRPARAPLRQRTGPAGDLHGDGEAVRAQARVRVRGRHRLRAGPPRQRQGPLALDRARARRRRDGRSRDRRLAGGHVQAERARLRAPDRGGGRSPGAALLRALRRGGRPDAGHARARRCSGRRRSSRAARAPSSALLEA